MNIKKTNKITIDDIIYAVSKVRHLTISEIMSMSRKKELAESRHIICFISQFAGYSSLAIGKALRRDHATILHGRNVALNLMDVDENFKKQVNEAILCLRLDHIR